MAANDTEDRRTRQKVFQSVLDEGPITASSLAKALELTPAAIRRHLDALESEGLIEVRELAGKQAGRGRPARHYVVTTAGHDSVSHSYDELAVNILRYMEDKHGKSAVEDFTEDLVGRLRDRLGPELDKRGGTTVASRSRALAAALTREGYAASATPVAAGTPLEAMRLCQGHCPIKPWQRVPGDLRSRTRDVLRLPRRRRTSAVLAGTGRPRVHHPHSDFGTDQTTHPQQ